MRNEIHIPPAIPSIAYAILKENEQINAILPADWEDEIIPYIGAIVETNDGRFGIVEGEEILNGTVWYRVRFNARPKEKDDGYGFLPGRYLSVK